MYNVCFADNIFVFNCVNHIVTMYNFYYTVLIMLNKIQFNRNVLIRYMF